MTSLELYTKLNQLPSDLNAEVNDFVDFLLNKKKKALKHKKTPKFGSAKGKVYISPDFDAPLDDFKEYM